MFNKHTVIIMLVLLAITLSYAASPEQLNSMPQDPNSLRSIIDDANKGYPSAQFKLGEMYSKGNGVPQDCNEAFKWFAKAAEQGHTEAQFKVGEMYSKGNGVPQDYNEACKRFTKIAIKGHQAAQCKLGEIYSDGNGFPQDYNEACKWFLKAADKSNATAQAHLALIYYDGKGVIEDYVEAYKWALLAGMNGEDVSKIKQDLTAKMTPDQIAEAQKLAKEFVAKQKDTKENSDKDFNSSKDEAKDALRAERLRNKIQKMQDAIELAETRIDNLPPITYAYVPPVPSESYRGHRLHRDEVPIVQKDINTARTKYKLLSEQELNYENMLHLAEKNSDLGIDVMDLKEKITKWQRRMEEVQRTIDYLKALINATPSAR